MRTTWLALSLFALVACGSDSKSGGKADAQGGGDSPVSQYMDAPPQVPATITISGVAAERGVGAPTPKAGVMITAYANSAPTTPVATATSDAQGNYSLTITTNGVALDGFVKATLSGYLDTYLYPPVPLVADFNKAALNLVTPMTFSQLSAVAGAPHQTGDATIALLVVDHIDTQMPIQGATVTSTPAGTYRYNQNGFPTSMTATDVDGTAYILNVAAGQVSLAAQKSGLTFKTHSVNAVADMLTTTVIVE